MRPLRLLLSLSICLVAILLLSYYAASRGNSGAANQRVSRVGTYFSWHSSSLFPPSAIISLTDDNSTFFLARPANFGPLLPAKGLSGQLWIGSGFGDDHLGRGGVTGAEGELGCSDVPGWGDGDYSLATAGVDASTKSKASANAVKGGEVNTGKSKRSENEPQGDGTDDHLHHPLPASGDLKNSEAADPGKKLAHADIQSLQETAEIAGKVVLLSRGGCGFLEKVKWVQRRGGTALIVGDNVRGGALVTMYARGDTSNVTIPSLFTSHTTAHLLSSLVPSGSLLDDFDAEQTTKLDFLLADKAAKASTGKATDAKKSTLGKLQSPKQADEASDGDGGKAQTPDGSTSSSGRYANDDQIEQSDQQGWFSSLFGKSSSRSHQDTRRPPSSGKIDWVQQKDFEEEGIARTDSQSTSKSPNRKGTSTKGSDTKADDGFVIGVQDWRDPDLLDAQKEAAQGSPDQQNGAGDTKTSALGGLKGGSITPGSGEYDRTNKPSTDAKSWMKEPTKQSSDSQGSEKTQQQQQRQQQQQQEESTGWLNHLGWSSKEPEVPSTDAYVKPPHAVTQVDRKAETKDGDAEQDEDEEPHEGLWVTLTPTSMSSSPFVDTLLVLVISPLVTLTIVYALLLLRSRIRRRRWRAPKSVVERLPVRTYHTVASTTGSNSTGTSPPRSPTTPTSATPLLHSGARPISQGQARPRSRTVNEIPATGSSFREANNSSIDTAQEKREAGLAEWRRRYGGRQKECVVCLEEYVDGVSRVMSLPCGHEFHAECM